MEVGGRGFCHPDTPLLTELDRLNPLLNPVRFMKEAGDITTSEAAREGSIQICGCTTFDGDSRDDVDVDEMICCSNSSESISSSSDSDCTKSIWLLTGYSVLAHINGEIL